MNGAERIYNHAIENLIHRYHNYLVAKGMRDFDAHDRIEREVMDMLHEET